MTLIPIFKGFDKSKENGFYAKMDDTYEYKNKRKKILHKSIISLKSKTYFIQNNACKNNSSSSEEKYNIGSNI